MRKSLPSITMWSIIILINVYYVYNFPIKHFSANWNGPFGTLLTVHVVFGMMALLLGPFQFFPSIRKTYPGTHRLIGRIYLLAILVAGISSVILAISDRIIKEKDVVFGTGMIGLALAWFLTSGLALWAIKNRSFVQHREWMVRSYVVTFAFSSYRIIAVTLNSYIQLDYRTQMSGIMAWACWAVPLLITEAVLQGVKIAKAGKALRKTAANNLLENERPAVVAAATDL